MPDLNPVAPHPDPGASPPISRTRLRLFALLVLGCLVLGGVAVVAAVNDGGSPAQASAGAADVLPSARDANRPVVMFRSLVDTSKGQPAVAPLSSPGEAEPQLAPLNCDRVHFNGGTGVCLARGGSFASGYEARIFGADLKVRAEVDVQGIASRVRVSPDGNWGSVTLFVSGHSYAVAGAFSTETTLLDLRRGRKVANLEDFTVSRDGRVIDAIDRNFWGTTFARDGDTFYATLATGGDTYLVRGSMRDRTMRTLHRNVECPSLSPDGTRIAYKKRVGGGSEPWRLTVLDLKTMRETPLPGTDGLDDQAEWLDSQRILYGADNEIRVVPADGSGSPTRFRARADSPAVVRWSPESPAS